MTDKNNIFNDNTSEFPKEDNNVYSQSDFNKQDKNEYFANSFNHEPVQPENSFSSEYMNESAYNSLKNSDGSTTQTSSYSTTPNYNTNYQTQQTSSNQGYYQNSNSSSNYGDSFQNTSQQNSNGEYRYSYSQTSPNAPKKPKKEKTKKKHGASVATIAICMLLSGVVGFGGGALANTLSNNGIISTGDGMTVQRVVNTVTPSGDDTSEMTTEQIAEATVNSVVEITTEIVETGSRTKQYITSGAGSGVIIAENGYIITNNHVIDGAQKIVVTLRDGTSYDAKLVGTDSQLDVALLKVDATGLQAAVLGDSDNIKVGQKAVAIGNPLGQLGGTVTEGIISALNRDVVIDDVTMNLLQTNAAINPGNSGGGLFNNHGELIGLVVAKTVDEQVEGLGFAVPINNVADILGDLKEHGYVTGRPQMGLELVDVSNEQTAMMYGVSEIGVYVSRVTGTEANEAGFGVGDRITHVAGKEVSNISEIKAILNSEKAGNTIEIKVQRNNKTETLKLVLSEQQPETPTTENNNGFNNPYDNNNGYNNGGNGYDNYDSYGGSIEDYFNSLF